VKKESKIAAVFLRRQTTKIDKNGNAVKDQSNAKRKENKS